MVFRSRTVTAAELEAETGWHLRAEGLCQGDVCVPFSADANAIDLASAADALGRPLVHDVAHGLYALGAPSGTRALISPLAPDLVLPDVAGHPFALASLRGQKVVLVAWASW